MARITIASLQAELASLNDAFEHAHALLVAVSAERDALQAQVNKACEIVEHLSRPAPRTQYVAPAWQTDRVIAMANAKAAAMALRTVVRVGQH